MAEDIFGDESTIIEEFQGDLVFNGVNGDTGAYGLSPMPTDKLARLIKGQPRPEDFPVPQEASQFDEAWALSEIAGRLESGEMQSLMRALAEVRLAHDTMLNEDQKSYLEILVEEIPTAATVNEQEALLQTHAEDILSEYEEYKEDEEDERVLTEGQKAFLQTLTKGKALVDEHKWHLLETLIRRAEEEETLGALKLKKAAPFPTKEGVDAAKIEQAGWAIVFPAKMSAKRRKAIKKALKPLLELRKSQAGKLYREFEGASGYRPGERLDQFFKHQKPEVRRGPADPEQMPFYVLLIGSPEEISYKFQYQLDVMRGVGRLDFGDDDEAYAAYAHNVVLAESGKLKLSRNATIFGVANPGDKATSLSSKYLVKPLLNNLKTVAPAGEIKLENKWKFTQVAGKDAKRDQLYNVLGGDSKQTPAFLLTASHGMEFQKRNPARQRKYQGAILCQDWGGPSSRLERNDFFAGEDLAADANLLGLVAMFFACYGAGTPKLDQFAMQAFKKRSEIAPEGFVAELPNQMLRRGALAVIGHVERAWGYSFVTPSGNADYQAFVTALRKLLNGDPVGLATDPSFDMRYADISSDLSSIMEELHWDPNYISDYDLAQKWTANNDARSYVIIGDPAVRIPFARTGERAKTRPKLDTAIDASFTAPATDEAETTETDESSAEIETESFDVAFGLKEQVSGLASSLQQFTQQLATTLNEATEEMMTLKVQTYAIDDLEAAAQGNTTEADLRAVTHVGLDGNMHVYVPDSIEAKADQALWQIHIDTVAAAQKSRGQFLQAMAEMTTNLLKILKP